MRRIMRTRDMDFLQFIKLVSIAKWLKTVSLVFVIGFLGLAGYITYTGVVNQDSSTLQAGASLLGVVFPLFLFIGFISFYESGTKPLQKATSNILLNLIPTALSRITVANKAAITIDTTQENNCIAYYKISATPLSLLIRLELNVYKLNLAILLPSNKFNADMSLVNKAFAHSLAGCKKEGYIINESLPLTRHAGHDYHELVLYKELPKDFLWNSAEKLYFTQDLVFFVTSLLKEAHPVFASFTESK